ncbi:hypothetical protein K443DRAFT_657898 [Laccaria amethystina LaAM-08-1]|uniref:Rhodopsin domain-containing protein n=1 Tax=Laccaria amethystina LaAM-08-1 TaxID=1095629 RepID=A0A0C9X2G2_9AGAR|nr:hypothetical protein K443DRAFT_657898 [Laccaria amethystina LaAM-08-1]
MPDQPWMSKSFFLTVLHSIALFSTIFRVVQRWSVSRLWWDDFLLLLPLGIDVMFLASLWTLYHRSFVLAFTLNNNDIIDSVWFGTFLWLLIIWSCRTSLALSMTRLFPPGHRSRQFSLTLTFYFVVTFILCIVTLSVACRTGNKIIFHGESCIKAGIMTTSLDLSGDILLIFVPLITFWRVRLPQTQRRLILITYSASFMTLIASISFCVSLYGSIIGNFNLGASIITMMAHIEATTSMIICNIVVITMFFYRIFRRGRDPEEVEESVEKSEETLNTHPPQSNAPTPHIDFTDPTWTSLEHSEPLNQTFEVASDPEIMRSSQLLT